MMAPSTGDDKDLVKLLLGYGPDVEVENKDGPTPLMYMPEGRLYLLWYATRPCA